MADNEPNATRSPGTTPTLHDGEISVQRADAESPRIGRPNQGEHHSTGDALFGTWKLAFLIALGAWWILLRRSRRLTLETQRLSRQQRALQFANNRLQNESDQLRRQAIHDPLTGALNRQAFAQGLRELIDHRARYRKPVYLIIFDLDHFKEINDRFGHLAGDSALRLVTGIAHEHLDSTDVFGRFGGDEFLIACADGDLESAKALAETIRSAVLDAATRHEPPLPGLTLSMGVAGADVQFGYSADDLFARADAALYQAKHHGRNCVVVADGSFPATPTEGALARHL